MKKETFEKMDWDLEQEMLDELEREINRGEIR